MDTAETAQATPRPMPAQATPPPVPAPAASTAPSAATKHMLGWPHVGDPPWAGSPEEETCPKGDWCGSVELARKFATAETPFEIGCPERLLGSAQHDIDAKHRGLEGMSLHRAMQGSFERWRTEQRRKTGPDDICCYHWFEYCHGRAWLDAAGPVVATTTPGLGWGNPIAQDVANGLPEAVRAALAQAWLHDALAEHASVASFARTTLELLAVGAPFELVAAAQRAGSDEIDHAKRCFAIAGRYAGTALEPGALAMLPTRPSKLVQLACDTFLEGCVGETTAALRVARQAAVCEHPVLRATLDGIAEDEARHAQLAWQTLTWTLEQGGDPVAQVVNALACKIALEQRLRPPVHQPETILSDPRHARLWAAHGRLNADREHAVRHDAWSGIVRPLLAQLGIHVSTPSQG